MVASRGEVGGQDEAHERAVYGVGFEVFEQGLGVVFVSAQDDQIAEQVEYEAGQADWGYDEQNDAVLEEIGAECFKPFVFGAQDLRVEI